MTEVIVKKQKTHGKRENVMGKCIGITDKKKEAKKIIAID